MEPGRGQPAALDGGPDLPRPADRPDRQHPPRRDLHRQALLAGRAHRAARPGRVPRLRDAAASADGHGAGAGAARPDRLVLGATRSVARRCAGARRCTTASCCPISCGRISCAVLDEIGCGPRDRASIRSGSRRSSSSAFRFSAMWPSARRHAGAARGAGALERAGRDRRHRRHRALCGQLARARAAQGLRRSRRPATSSPATAMRCRCARRTGAM